MAECHSTFKSIPGHSAHQLAFKDTNCKTLRRQNDFYFLKYHVLFPEKKSLLVLSILLHMRLGLARVEALVTNVKTPDPPPA